MRLGFILLIFPTLDSFAYTAEELQIRAKTLMEVGGSFEKAESELPLFEGLQYSAQTVRRLTPPSSCKKSTQLFEAQMSLDRKLIDNIGETERWFDGGTRNFDYSHQSFQQLCERRNSFNKSREEFGAILEASEEEKILHDPEINDGDLDSDPKGEFVKMECALPAIIIFQYRKKHLAMMNKLMVAIDAGIDAACTFNRASLEETVKFVKLGERAYNSRGEDNTKR